MSNLITQAVPEKVSGAWGVGLLVKNDDWNVDRVHESIQAELPGRTVTVCSQYGKTWNVEIGSVVSIERAGGDYYSVSASTSAKPRPATAKQIAFCKRLRDDNPQLTRYTDGEIESMNFDDIKIAIDLFLEER